MSNRFKKLQRLQEEQRQDKSIIQKWVNNNLLMIQYCEF